jgi:MinD superfamily P-loop ATPase
MTARIHQYALERNMEIAGNIPFDENVDEALLKGKSIIEFPDSPAAKEISKIWKKVVQMI